MVINKRKIICTPIGGIGNQIFQFLFCQHLSKITNRQVLISNINFNYYKKFSPSISLIFDKKYLNFISDFKFIYYKYFTLNATFEDISIFKVDDLLIKNIIESNKDVIFIKGYFQNLSLYIKDPDFLNLFNVDFQTKIHRDGSYKIPVAIHIRRGDYYNDKKVKKIHGILGDNFFIESINYFKKLYGNTKFYIFSDDIDYVSKLDYLKDLDVEFIKEIDPIKSFIKLSSYQNYIISNSTFSLLASFISSNKNKHITNVCIPKIWHSNILFKDTNLYVNDSKINFNIIDNQ